MFCTSVEINRFLNHFLSNHLTGIDLQYAEKFLINTPCQGKKGHDLSSSYDLPLTYTAKILGRKKESVRLAQERLHALGLITVDGKTWEEYRKKDGSRRCTGYTQVVALSGRFIDVIGRVIKARQKVDWLFRFCDGFLEKQRKRKARAVEAKKRFLESLATAEKVITNRVGKEIRRRIRRSLADQTVRHRMEEEIKGLVDGGYASSYQRALDLMKAVLRPPD